MEEKKHLSGGKCLLLLMVILCLLAGGAAAGMNLAVGLSTRERIHAPNDTAGLRADCILILGCGLRKDGFPSQMLRDRLDVGIAAYEAGVSDRILMSGDHGRPDYDEVNAMKDYAISKGVPSEAIFMDHAGFSTYESMARAKRIFGAESAVVVTQHYHLYRALYDAEAMGIRAEGLSADKRHFARQVYFSLREAAARCKDFLFCVWQPDPTYLGEPISLKGSGDVTNDR